MDPSWVLFTMNLDFESNRSHTHRTKTPCARAHARNAEVLPNLVRNSRILKMDWGGMTGISQIWLAGKSPINAINGNVNENIIKLNGGGWIFSTRCWELLGLHLGRCKWELL